MTLKNTKERTEVILFPNSIIPTKVSLKRVARNIPGTLQENV